MTSLRRCAALLVLVALATLPAQAAERVIEKSIEIAATLDQAWEAWTTREGIVSFFAPDAVVEPRVGGAFDFHIDPAAPAGSKGANDMRYLALQPKKMLSFDWNAPPHLPAARAQRTLVIVRFEPLGEKLTRVTLHHTAWGNVLGNRMKRFDSDPQDWSAWLAQLQKMRAAQIAASAPRQ